MLFMEKIILETVDLKIRPTFFSWKGEINFEGFLKLRFLNMEFSKIMIFVSLIWLSPIQKILKLWKEQSTISKELIEAFTLERLKIELEKLEWNVEFLKNLLIYHHKIEK